MDPSKGGAGVQGSENPVGGADRHVAGRVSPSLHTPQLPTHSPYAATRRVRSFRSVIVMDMVVRFLNQ